MEPEFPNSLCAMTRQLSVDNMTERNIIPELLLLDDQRIVSKIQTKRTSNSVSFFGTSILYVVDISQLKPYPFGSTSKINTAYFS